MKTSRNNQLTTKCLYLAMELSLNNWKLAFSTRRGQKPRRRDVPARQLDVLQREIAGAKARFGLAEDAPVVCCYEAGRDGFWLHRYLISRGIENVVMDPASIEVNRRKRRAKTDRIDAGKLLSTLIRWHEGEADVWSVVSVPSEADEDGQRLGRELRILRGEQTRHGNRIKGFLIGVGIHLDQVDRDLAERLDSMRMYNGQPLPGHLHQQVLREFLRMQLVNEQIRDLEKQRAEAIRHAQDDPQVEMVRRLLKIRGIGANSSWMFVKEAFGWRAFANRRQVGAFWGLAPTPYNSGNEEREQGISKAGNRHLRSMAIEIAWCWLRFQPDSRLTRWYQKRFARGSKRQRRVGIVALARKLMIVLWRYLKEGNITDGFALREELPALAYTRSLS
jgi:transposase